MVKPLPGTWDSPVPADCFFCDRFATVMVVGERFCAEHGADHLSEILESLWARARASRKTEAQPGGQD